MDQAKLEAHYQRVGRPGPVRIVQRFGVTLDDITHHLVWVEHGNPSEYSLECDCIWASGRSGGCSDREAFAALVQTLIWKRLSRLYKTQPYYFRLETALTDLFDRLERHEYVGLETEPRWGLPWAFLRQVIRLSSDEAGNDLQLHSRLLRLVGTGWLQPTPTGDGYMKGPNYQPATTE